MDLRRPRPRTPSRAGWLLLAVVVAGLFAMHGLGSHGLHSGGAAPVAHTLHHDAPVASGPVGSVDPVGSVGSVGSVGPVGTELEQPAHEAPADGSGVLEMCLALLALGLLWLASRRLRGVAWTLPRDTVTARLDALRVTARGPGPPRRAELSLWRC